LIPEGDRIQSLDVKYTIERSFESHIAVDWVSPHKELERCGRSRRRVEPAPVLEEADTKDVAKAHKPAKSNKRQRNKSAANSIEKEGQGPTLHTFIDDTTNPQDKTFPSSGGADDDDTSSVVSVLSEQQLPRATTVTAPSLAMEPSMTCFSSSSSIKITEPTNTLPTVDFQVITAAARGAGKIKAFPSGHQNASKLVDVGGSSKLDVPSDRVTLDQVYSQDMQQARIFIDQAVLNASSSSSNRDEDLAEAPLPSIPVISKEESTFISLFQELLNDDGDGCMEETAVLERLNELAGQRGLDERFDAGQVTLYIDSLCDQDKIMRSDGMLYNI
jgi:hypothetical protein